MVPLIRNLPKRLNFISITFLRWALLLALFSTAAATWVAAQTSPQFEKQVLPILGKYCLTCDGATPDGARPHAAYLFSLRAQHEAYRRARPRGERAGWVIPEYKTPLFGEGGDTAASAAVGVV